MPISPAKKAERLALGQCSLCTRKRAKLKGQGGKLARFCDWHLEYYRQYRKTWLSENIDLKTHRCSVCRELGHTLANCKDPRAVKLRADAVPHNVKGSHV